MQGRAQLSAGHHSVPNDQFGCEPHVECEIDGTRELRALKLSQATCQVL